MSAIWTNEGSFQASVKIMAKTFRDEVKNIPEQWKEHLNEYTPEDKRRYVTFMPFTGLGFFQSKGEGEAPKFDTPNEMIPSTAFFQTFALAVAVTREATMEDPLNIVGQIPAMLAKSMKNSKDQIFVAPYNLAFRPDFPIYDGQPLISTAHPLNPIVTPTGVVSRVGASFSNSLGAMQLTPESLRYSEILAATLLDDRLKKDAREHVDLVVSPYYSQIAEEVAGTPTHPYENTKKKNLQAGRWNVKVYRDLSSPYAWFTRSKKGEPGSDCHGVTVFFRWASHVWGYIDGPTQDKVIAASFRPAMMAWTWKGLNGSSGAGPVSI